MKLPPELTTCNICNNRFSWNTDSESQPNLIDPRLPVQSQACEHYFCYSCIVSCHLSEIEKTNRPRKWICCMICKKEKAFRSDQPILYRAIITLGALRIGNDGNDEQDMIARLGANLEEASLIHNPSEGKFKVKVDTASMDSESVPVREAVVETVSDAVVNVATRSLVYDMRDSQGASVEEEGMMEASIDVVRSPNSIADPSFNLSLKREATSIVGNNSGEASKRVRRFSSRAFDVSIAEELQHNNQDSDEDISTFAEDVSNQVSYCIVNSKRNCRQFPSNNSVPGSCSCQPQLRW